MDQQFRPLLDVLNEIKEHYNVSFLYEPTTLEDKKVKTPVNYRSKLEGTLSKILEPQGLTFKKINAKTYSILLQESDAALMTAPDETLTTSITESKSEKEMPLFEMYVQPVDIVVSGVLTDESGTPLPGVNVLVKGSTVGTTTDADGRYTLSVPDENAILVVSFIGYNRKRSPLEIKPLLM